jgi:NAD-dependent SIR2 family protein deacetylase
VIDGLHEATELIRQADGLLIGAGAGMGVDSGLPDFRGRDGFWKAYPPFARLGLDFFQMANPEGFARDPALAWGFYGHRFNLYRDTPPHPGFDILRRWGDRMEHGSFVFTSNIDGHFQKAGFGEDQVVECHGSLNHLQCTRPCSEAIWPAGDLTIDVDMTQVRATGDLPTCPQCGAIARPNVLMFGDWHWNAERSSDQEHRLTHWLARKECRSLVIVECGAGNTVPTVRVTSEGVASTYGGRLIRINPRDSDVPTGQMSIADGALKVLKGLDALLG